MTGSALRDSIGIASLVRRFSLRSQIEYGNPTTFFAVSDSTILQPVSEHQFSRSPISGVGPTPDDPAHLLLVFPPTSSALLSVPVDGEEVEGEAVSRNVSVPFNRVQAMSLIISELEDTFATAAVEPESSSEFLPLSSPIVRILRDGSDTGSAVLATYVVIPNHLLRQLLVKYQEPNTYFLYFPDALLDAHGGHLRRRMVQMMMPVNFRP